MILSGETRSNLWIRAQTGHESISSIVYNESDNQGDSACAQRAAEWVYRQIHQQRGPTRRSWTMPELLQPMNESTAASEQPRSAKFRQGHDSVQLAAEHLDEIRPGLVGCHAVAVLHVGEGPPVEPLDMQREQGFFHLTDVNELAPAD